jgi:hypothetical protein
MVYRNLRQAQLQEVGMTKIRGYHDFFNIFSNRRDFRTDCRVDSRTDKHHQIILLNWSSLRHIILNQSSPLFPPTKYAMIPQHGPFSLHTMLEDMWLHITAFPTHMVQPLDESQGSSPLQGHGSWLMCEVALRLNESGVSWAKPGCTASLIRKTCHAKKNPNKRGLRPW